MTSQIYNFEKYCHKVFKLKSFLDQLIDTRINPKIDHQHITLGVLYGSAFRIKSIAQIEEETKIGVLQKRIGAISDDSIAYGFDFLDTDSINRGWEKMLKTMKRNGMLRNNAFHDWVVGVLDGIETLSSYNRHCNHCLTRTLVVDGKEVTQYYHRMSVLILIGYEFPIPVGIEMQRPGEDEVACGLRLLKRLRYRLGVRFIDLVIGDALYCRPQFFKECEHLGLKAGAVLKENQEDLLMTAEKQTRLVKPFIQDDSEKEKLKVWDLPEVYWYTADKDVRVIWAERRVWDWAGTGENKQKDWLDKKVVFAFCEQTNPLPTRIVYDISRHRWDIDTSLFQDMTQNWHLKHPTLHFNQAYENLLIIRLISYFLFMFFFYRHINSRRKDIIEGYVKMARILYRSACDDLNPKLLLVD